MILVGGGSIIVTDKIAGVGQIIKPEYHQVANAVGAAIAKVSGSVDKTVVPGIRTIDEEIASAKELAIEQCVAAGGNRETIELVEIDVVPISYVTNGATRLLVRVVGDLVEGYEENHDTLELLQSAEDFQEVDVKSGSLKEAFEDPSSTLKGSSYEILDHVDLKSYCPRIEGDLWYLSELDLRFLQDGTGVLGVGSCGEPYPCYLACLLAIRGGKEITIRRQDTLPDDAVVLVAGFMVSNLPSWCPS